MSLDRRALWLLLQGSCHLFAFSSATAMSVSSSGSLVSFKDPLRPEPEVRLRMPEITAQMGNVMMNVTIVDARDIDRDAHSILDIESRHRDKNSTQKVSVVSSWILFHMSGNHTDSLKQPNLPKLVGGLRNAVADALEVCRSSVGIVDMRAINIDVIDKGDDLAKTFNSKEEADEDSSEDTDGKGTLLERAATLVRNTLHSKVKQQSHVNLTQMKAVYEVRIFEEMRWGDDEIGRRIDKFQIYSKFSDLSRLVSRSLSEEAQLFQDVLLDDVGYAARHQLWRPPLSLDDLGDCSEEVMLHDARQIHQFIVAISLLIVALITCAGSTVFTIKHASSVPSRMNPLVQANTDS